MGFFAIFQAIAQGLTNAFSTYSYIQENKEQAKEIARQAQIEADERAKQAKYAMQKQKTSFLKGGVYFDSGTPVEVLNETYETAQQDIQAINDDSVKAQKKLQRAGRTALFSFLIDPVGNNGGQYANDIYSYFKNRNTSSSTSTVTGSIAGTKMSGGQINTRNIV